MIVVDTSGLLAALFPDQRRHAECARVLTEMEGPFILSPFVLAELDYLVAKLANVETELRLLHEVASGAYALAPFLAGEVQEANSLIEQYSDLGIGLADASMVVLARRHRTRDVLTLDERHFRALTGPGERSFRILPADAQP